MTNYVSYYEDDIMLEPSRRLEEKMAISLYGSTLHRGGDDTNTHPIRYGHEYCR